MTTSIQKDALLSQFSVLAYEDEAYLRNSANLPNGWKLVDFEIKGPFAGFAFQNEATSEVIVAYRGTDGLNDVPVDSNIFTGSWDPQFQQGMDFLARVRANSNIFQGGYDPSKLLVTGHSLGGTIAQIVAQAYGLDGSTIDPGAAALIVQTPEFQAAAIAAGLPAAGLGIADSFSNHVVLGSVVSNGTGPQLGKVLYVPSLSFNGEQALTAFLVGMVNPVAGFAYAMGTDQITNRHSSEQVSQALQLMAGAAEAGSLGDGTLVLSPKVIDQSTDPLTGITKPVYSQTEFEIRNEAGDLQGTVKFSGSGSDRQFEVFDAAGQLKSTTTLAPGGAVTVQPIQGDSIVVAYLPESVTNRDGMVTTTYRNPSGIVTSASTTTIFEDGSTSETVRYADGRTIRTNTDENGAITSRASIQYFEEDGSSIESVTYADGRTVKLSYDGDGKLLSQQEIQAGGKTLINTIATYGPTLTDALSLIHAIQSGEPLPVVASGLRLANDVSALNGAQNLNLDGAANVASGVLSLMSLDASLKKGDALGALTAGANVVSFGTQAYIDFAGAANAGVANEINTFLNGEKGVTNSLGMTEGVLPYLNLVNSIAQGDAVGVVSSTLMLFPGTQPLGVALAVADMVFSLFGGDDVPDPWGAGRYVWTANGIGISAQGETGGEEAVQGVMDATLATLNALIEQARENSPGSPLGLIPNRLPTVGYDTAGFRYADIDPLTGQEQHPALRFDTAGRPYNAAPGSPESYQSIVEGMVYSALARDAIAPQWEVDTARLQTQAGDPKAGLTEEERAGRDGQLAAPLTGSTQRFRPIAFDLDGDGIEATDKAGGVAFDVDDSGYLKQTAWVKPDDGMLVLDRDYNGQFDSGKELFSNAAVAVKRRGLAALGWVDANTDGRITSADPVWNELKVWRDQDQDGTQDAGEVQSLAQLGVTELDYKLGTFTQNGQKRQLASPDLEADKDGARVSVVPEGILVEQSADGHMSLLVTRVDDLTAVEANRDGVSGYEDVELVISAADLLANDSFGGQSAANLTITGVSGFRRGTGYLDANGFVHFRPEANYFGNEAGFDYSVRAVNGQTGTAQVDISLQNVNDAPTATDQRSYRAVYGYTAADGNGQGGETHYSPYTETNCYGQTIEHNVPVAWEDTGAGKVVGADIDDPVSSLSYQLVGNPQYGAVTLDAQGNYSYTEWIRPGEAAGAPSSCVIGGGGAIQPGTDAFRVRVTDPHGASSDITVTVPHPDLYYPPRPSGGGGGCCPVAVDLDGNGFAFTPAEDSSVFFDINADGWKRQVSWTKPGDGWLAFDANGNGRVDDGAEMVFSNYAQNAQGDLAAVAEAFDSDGDSLLTAADEKWAKFGVWADANQDGVCDAGEFRTLADIGVASLALVGDGSFSVQDGNTIHGIATITMNDGTTRNAADVALRVTDQVLDGSGAVVPQSPFSPDGEVLEGTGDKDLILGKSGNNVIYGYAGDDVVFEDGGNDVIDAGDGNDMVYAGTDNDLVLGGGGDDTIYAGLGDDKVFGGDGHDAIFAEGGNDIVFGGDGNDLISGGWGNDVLSGDGGDDQIYGESGFDALFGRDGNDELLGMDGNDRLDGGVGSDLLDGGAGADEMIGGTGDDIYVVDDPADSVTELAGEGNDTIHTVLDGYVLGPNVENLTLDGVENISGTGNELDNQLRGNAGRNTLTGGAGNDMLDGGAGVDTLIGGIGDDTYLVDEGNDLVFENAGEGIDTVVSRASYALPEHVENLKLIGVADIDATGNALDNRIDGNAGNNRLDGGFGADLMTGGGGDDDYVVDNAKDLVVEALSEGDDTIHASLSYVLPEHVENLILTGSGNFTTTGNSADNLLVGNAGNNALYGGNAGTDILAGMDGDDLLHDVVGRNAFLGGSGNDRIEAGGDNDFIAGGRGNDVIDTGRGTNLVAFNRGDGQDMVLPGAAGGTDTLLLGSGIDIYDLTLRRSGSDLLLDMGDDDRIAFKDWYADHGHQSIAALELIDGNPYRDRIGSAFYHYVETFNFAALVENFDAASATTTATTTTTTATATTGTTGTAASWSMLDSLLAAHIAGSDDAAIGGELAASYADNGALTMSPREIRQSLHNPDFGKGMQSIGSRLDESVPTYHIG